MRARSTALLTVSAVLLAGAVLALPAQWYAFGYVGVGGACVLATVLRARRGGCGGAWAPLAAGLVLWVAGDVIYGLVQDGRGVAPFPSVADGPYVAGYALVGAGLLRAGGHRRCDLAAAVDGLLFATAVAVLPCVFWIAPMLADGSVSDLARAVSVSYPVADLVLLAIAVSVALSGGWRGPVAGLLAAGLAAVLAGDVAYNVSVLRGTYGPGGLADVLYLLSYALWVAAALHPAPPRGAAPAPRAARSPLARAGLLAVAPLGAPLVAVIDFALGRPVDLTAVLLVWAGLYALTGVRALVLARRLPRRSGAVVLAAPVLPVAIALALVQVQQEVQQRRAEEHRVEQLNADLGLLALRHTELRRLGHTAIGGAEDDAVLVRRVRAGAAALTRDGLDAAAPGLAEHVRQYLQRRAEERDRLLNRLPSTGAARAFDVASVTVARDQRALEEAQHHAVSAADLRGRRVTLLILLAGASALSILAWAVARIQRGAATAEQRAAALSESDARLRALLRNSSDALTIVDADTRVLKHTATLERILGYSRERLLATPLADFLEPGRADAARAALEAAGSAQEPRRSAWRLRRRDGTWLDADVVVSDRRADPLVGGFVLNLRDVTERVALERELRHRALHDPLTGLANRELLEQRIATALEAPGAGEAALLYLDLDDFKTVNDSLGHAVGDELIGAVGRRLAGSLRASDTLARVGGDEFAVLLEAAGEERAAVVTAERLLTVFDAPFTVAGHEHTVTASVGIAMTGHCGDGSPAATASQLLRNADVAMYEAKRRGMASVEAFDPATHAALTDRLWIRTDLRRALDRGELSLVYQPIVSLDGVELAGVEALLRWQHPERGPVSPGEFIPVAEQSGLIVELGRWVLREACRRLAGWKRELPGAPGYVAVNVAGAQLQRPGFPAEVRAALEDSGLDPACLLLEVTETALLADTQGNIARLASLRELGVHLAIDDFGTGYSSLSYLRRFPMDVLKIDKSFVDEVALRTVDAKLVGAMIAMAKSLGLRTVAEGIEDAGQRHALAALGCDLGQGYLFARPLPPAELAAFAGAPARACAAALPIAVG